MTCFQLLFLATWHTFCADSGEFVQQSEVRVSLLRWFFQASSTLSMYISDQRIRFISCSATLANPAQHMSTIFCLDVSELDIVSNDGAPSGRKEYIIWNPPPIDAEDPALGRRSSISEASQLMRFLMKRGIRVILFCKVTMR